MMKGPLPKTKTIVPPQKLIVIGAGMAGLRLSETVLQHAPHTNITIVEANHYVGGRIRHARFASHTVEMGANWISGLENTYPNPVWNLARNVNLQGHFVDRAQEEAAVVLGPGGNNLHQPYFQAMNRFETVISRAIDYCKTLNKDDTDRDVRSLLEQCGWPASPNTIERLVELNLLTVWGANELETFSAKFNLEENANDVDLGHEEFFVEDSRGFNTILNDMVDHLTRHKVDLKLQETVQSVTYQPNHVSVTTDKGITYTADAIVCTVSLGVLQSNSIEFVPALPSWKQTALDQVEMFTFAKVYVQLDGAFWDQQPNQLILVSESLRYPLWMRYRNCGKHQNLFLCYLGGREAERVERLSSEELTDEIEAHFRQAFVSTSHDTVNYRPTRVFKTDWSNHPHFCGSYSLFPVNAFCQSPILDFTRPLPGDTTTEPTLYFAGEAYDDKFNGWVQGAYRSGERVAMELLGRKPDDDNSQRKSPPKGNDEKQIIPQASSSNTSAALTLQLPECVQLLRQHRIRLVVFDMDQTAVRQHSRGCLQRSQLRDYCQQATPAFRQLVPVLLEHKIHVAIATHSDEAEFVWDKPGKPNIHRSTHILGAELAASLLETCFGREVASQIKIVAYNPSARGTKYSERDKVKRYHLRTLQEHHGVGGSEMLFFDDTPGVVQDCNQHCGVWTVLVDANQGFGLSDLLGALRCK